ncbi:hypothetical protein Tco_1566041, partial [Tanacetum coccineum]
IIMVDVIPPDHVEDVPVVEPNQHDDVPVVPEPILVDEDEDPKEDEFKEEEDPQEEEEDDIEVNIEEDENEHELSYPYEEVDPLNPPPPASESEPEDVNKVENPIESEDETVPASVYEVGESSTARMHWSRRKANQRTSIMHVENLGNTKDKVECKKLKKELEEARLSNTFLRFVFEERLNEAINVLIKDEKSPSSKPQESSRESYVNADIAAERAIQANVRNDARGSGLVRGQDAAPVVCECTFVGFIK